MTKRKPTPDEPFAVTRSQQEWKETLSPAQFAILREQATERAFTNSLGAETSPLLKEGGPGVYHCAGCDQPVYRSETKFDSGTGWPSFWDPIAGAIATRSDRSLLFRRTEVHCARCGGHLGHVFDDGPAPSGQRHCLNGLALRFHPTAEP